MSKVWACQLPDSITSKRKSTVKIVLLKIADHANDNGKAWPSMAKIAHDTELSERSVVRAINELKQANLIAVKTHRSGMTKKNTYFINTPMLDRLRCDYDNKPELVEDENPFTNMDTRCDMMSKSNDMMSKTSDQMSHKPSYNHQESSNIDVITNDEYFSIQDLSSKYPRCTEAMEVIRQLKLEGHHIYDGGMRLSVWDDCEDAMNSVDFDCDYIVWWMEEKANHIHKIPSLDNMLASGDMTTFAEMYEVYIKNN